MSTPPTLRMKSARLMIAVSLALGALTPPPSPAAVDDDLFLFTTTVAPNVAILLDNSGSMNHIVWHEAFDPDVTPSCGTWSNTTSYSYSSDLTLTSCGRTRTLYHDPSSLSYTRIEGRYLNWLFSTQSDAYISDYNINNNGATACAGAGPATFAKYKRNRMTAAKQVVREVICLVNTSKDVRFGLAVFREPRDASWVDPNGGYIEVGIDDYDTAHATKLETAITNELPDTWTPLAESLFQLYTYFMSRNTSDLPDGRVSGKFPAYQYTESNASGGGPYSASGPPTVPDSPVQYACQKSFVIVITDGESTMDDFDADPSSTAAGFSSFNNLIGDYNADSETETGYASEGTLLLDDVAKYMHETDYRPDLDGDQTLDVYTIGFTTNDAANALLKKAAEQGNGIFYTSNNAEELTQAIVGAITDIIEKSQSFTAATVPSTRTAAGGDFYTSFFLPSSKRAFWQGHLRSFGIDAAGNLFDSTGSCPLTDDTVGECNSGPFTAAASPFWDAGEEVPEPGLRKLYTTRLVGASPSRVDFDDSLTAADLDISPFTSAPDPAPNPNYLGSNALNAEGLAEEVVAFARGCEFGTGVSSADVSSAVTCTKRSWLLGDIFHSSPAVVANPGRPSTEASYAAFKSTWSTRPRVIYAGANDGFLHAFEAGTWDAGASPPGYTRGTGEELWGVMPWEARKNIKNLHIDSPSDRTYYVDGSPQAADIWLYPSPTTGTKSIGGAEWRTGLFGGMRQGGKGYYAIDITDPDDASYPSYVWDFPGEADPDDISDATSIAPYLGESWSTPIITRVKVAIDGNDNGGLGFERWVMIVGGGFSEDGDPNDSTNYDPAAYEGRSIVIVDITSGKVLGMKRFDPLAAVGDPQRDMVYAIPSTPAVFDLDSDGFADVIYVGDLGGQLFKWVISEIGEDRVNDSSAVGDFSQPSWPFKKFFSAPITHVAGVDYYRSFYFPPAGALVGRNLWLAIGSGERGNIGFEGIAGEDENNRFYVFLERDPFETIVPAYSTLAEADLTDLSNTQACTSITDPGYFFKLADGEKIVTNTEIFARIVLAGTFTPTNTGNPCTSKGVGTLYAFRVDCGGGYFTDGGGAPTRSFDIGEGMPTDPQVSVGVDGKDNLVFIEKSGADLESISAPTIPNNAKTLLYWREVR